MGSGDQELDSVPPSPTEQEGEEESAFDWDAYLTQGGFTAAPPECFSQSFEPPENKFEEGMKLEVADPRCNTNMCVATVIHKLGPRLRLRLDGSDTCNDFWLMCDSSEIKPIGHTESRGGRFILPPIGFKDDMSKWRKFLTSVLENCNAAPKECFASERVRSSAQNLFSVGMKLEAVDKKNPFLISPATVSERTAQELKITYDGWGATFDSWFKYTSRDLFPVGWCRANGHPLQPPPGWDAPPPSTPLSSAPPPVHTSGSSSGKGNAEQVPSRPASRASEASSSAGPTPASSKSRGRGGGGGRKRAAASRAAAKAPSQPAKPAPSPAPPTSKPDLIISVKQPLDNTHFVIHVNAGCNAGQLLDGILLERLPAQLGPGSVNHLVREAVQALVNCAQDVKAVFTAVAPGDGHMVVTGDFDGNTNARHLPFMGNSELTWQYLRRLLNHLGACPNLLHHSPFCAVCQGRYAFSLAKRPRLEETEGGSGSGRIESFIVDLTRRLDHDVDPPVGPGGPNPMNWSVEDVVSYIGSAEDDAVNALADEFRKNEIDGKALLLLTSELVIKYMSVRLGPALKVAQLIDQLRKALALRKLL